MRQRGGFMLIEALVAASLSALVVVAAVMLLQLQSRIAQQTGERSERNDAVRSALFTLQAELRSLTPSADLRALARDSIAVRIFRGRLIVCAQQDSIIFARYRGLRAPDPAKDSALQIGVENAVSVISTTAVRDSACGPAPGEQVIGLHLSGPAPPGSMWLVFESGTYHLSGHALRYRRGSESRQPITNEVLNDRLGGFTAVRDSLLRGIVVTLWQRTSTASSNAHIIFQNSR